MRASQFQAVVWMCGVLASAASGCGRADCVASSHDCDPVCQLLDAAAEYPDGHTFPASEIAPADAHSLAVFGEYMTRPDVGQPGPKRFVPEGRMVMVFDRGDRPQCSVEVWNEVSGNADWTLHGSRDWTEPLSMDSRFQVRKREGVQFHLIDPSTQ